MKKNCVIVLLCLLSLLFQRSHAAGAELSYLLIPGIPGDAQRSQWASHIEVFGYSHEVISPRDPASGLPTGKRQHGVFKIIKRVGNNSPLLMQKQVQNGNLSQIELKLLRPNPTGDGTIEQFYKYTLKNARVVGIRNWTPNALDSTAPDVPPMEEVSIVYQTIQWTYLPGDVTFEDSLAEK